MRDNFRTYEQWLADNPAPDLGKLVEAFGVYSNITAEAWATYDEWFKQWNTRRMRRHW